jgi:hypothetical protein
MQLFGWQDTAFVESVLEPVADRLAEIEELEVGRGEHGKCSSLS